MSFEKIAKKKPAVKWHWNGKFGILKSSGQAGLPLTLNQKFQSACRKGSHLAMETSSPGFLG